MADGDGIVRVIHLRISVFIGQADGERIIRGILVHHAAAREGHMGMVGEFRIVHRISNRNQTGFEVEFAAVIGGNFLSDTGKFGMKLAGGLERAVAIALSVAGMAAVTPADHVLLRQFFPAHIIARKNSLADLAEMFGAFGIVSGFVETAVPQRFFAQLYDIVLKAAVNHAAEPTVADGNGFNPPGSGLFPEKFHNFLH